MAENEWVCPKCGTVMPGPNLLCSGIFTDTDHPSNVQPRPRDQTSWPASPFGGVEVGYDQP